MLSQSPVVRVVKAKLPVLFFQLLPVTLTLVICELMYTEEGRQQFFVTQHDQQIKKMRQLALCFLRKPHVCPTVGSCHVIVRDSWQHKTGKNSIQIQHKMGQICRQTNSTYPILFGDLDNTVFLSISIICFVHVFILRPFILLCF